jgi:hypothetical protein
MIIYRVTIIHQCKALLALYSHNLDNTRKSFTDKACNTSLTFTYKQHKQWRGLRGFRGFELPVAARATRGIRAKPQRKFGSGGCTPAKPGFG